MKKSLLALGAIVVGLVLAGASCSRQAVQVPTPSTGGGVEAQAVEIKLANNDRLGRFFTDAQGMTLYIFTKDTADKSVCEGPCLAAWPAFYGDEVIVPAGLNQNDFGVTTRSNGRNMITYKGWPLYYYYLDQKPGDVLGEGVNNVWFVVKADYGLLYSTDTANYLVDEAGKTLYYFKNDTKDKSVCAGQCLVNWPAYLDGDDFIPSTLNKSDFGEITRDGGQKQSTYKGWPLYYYIGDEKRGDKKGQGLNDVWFVIDPVALAPAK